MQVDKKRFKKNQAPVNLRRENVGIKIINNRSKAMPSTSRFLVHLFFLFISILLLVIYFTVDVNKNWFNQRIITYWDEFIDQKDQLDIEYRKEVRLGDSYSASRAISETYKKIKGKDDTLLLMPPSAYIKAAGLIYHVPEPAVFYYYTGIKTVWSNSIDARKANWYFDFANGKMVLNKIQDTIQLQRVLVEFNKYKASL